MSVARAHHEPLQYQVYAKSQANIRRLKDRLPEDVVVNLAREVIRRVALKDRNLQSVAAIPCPVNLENICHELLSDDDKAVVEMIAGLRADGFEAEEIYLKHLAGAARMLGQWWEEDKVNFSQVTIASSRMFAIMRSMRHLFEPAIPTHAKSAIFASVPGENHTMGVRMAADLFRKKGWDILLKVGLDHEALVAEIEQEPTGIVGLSISGRHSVDALSRLAVALHISCPQAYLLVSGQDIKEAKPVLSLMGFDGIASDIDEAKEKMSALWERKIMEKRVH
ncbi:MAG: cobalamin-dependent protein [Sulfitobacter sp.]